MRCVGNVSAEAVDAPMNAAVAAIAILDTCFMFCLPCCAWSLRFCELSHAIGTEFERRNSIGRKSRLYDPDSLPAFSQHPLYRHRKHCACLMVLCRDQ